MQYYPHYLSNLLVASVLLVSTRVVAAEEALFPEQITACGQNFQKLGEYRYTYRFFFDLYEAALFVEPGAKASDVLTADCAYHLRFRYLRTIDKPIILKSADRMLDKNLSKKELSRIKERVDTLNRYYTTVTDGDVSSLTYIPEQGSTLTINGKEQTVIEGQDFAQLYFRIWLGEKPISSELRDHLLGKIK